jgi:hypothetical protein
MTYQNIAYAFKGAQVACPYGCVIAEGFDGLTLPNGKKAAHHGHVTSRGCPLNSTANDLCGYSNSSGQAISSRFIPTITGEWGECNHDDLYDLVFVVRDQGGKVMSDTPYRIKLDSGSVFLGRTSVSGMTEVIHSSIADYATLEVPYYGDVSSATDPDLDSDACTC